ncbi:MAG: hypothetical protein WC683_07975 [bacterium]
MTMTVPAIARWDDWRFDLCDSNGVALCSLNEEAQDFEGTAIPGATAHRLETCSFKLPAHGRAASYIDPDVLQMIRITPYEQSAQALWGLIGKVREQYGKTAEQDYLTVSCVGVEYLLHSRQVYHWDGATIGWINVTGGVDDFLKEMVRQTAVAATCGTDVDGNSRAWTWGTLVVAANTTAGTVDSYREGEGFLDEVIAAYAKDHGVGWELRPTVSGGAVTFTFATAVPNNGTNKSTGASRVIINDFADVLVPSASRYRDWQLLVTDMHGMGYSLVASDTTLRTAWGRWEGACNETVHNQVELQLAQFGLKEGFEAEFEASAAAGGACRWLAEYYVGDIVLRNNTRLGIVSEAATIAAIKFTFPNRVLKLEIRWGEKEPNQKQKQGGTYHRLAPGIPVFPRYATPVAVGAANAMGTIANRDMVTGDHVHKAVMVVGAQTVTPDSGIWTYVAGTGMVITGNSPSAHQITFASSVTGGCYWDRAANGGDPYLFPRTSGDDVHVLGGGAFRLYRADSTLAYLLENTGDVLIYGNDGTTQKIGLEAQNGSVGTVHCFTAGRLSSGDGHENVGRLNLYKGLNDDADAHFYDGSIAHWYAGDEHTGLELVTISGTDGSIMARRAVAATLAASIIPTGADSVFQTKRANGTLATWINDDGDVLIYRDAGGGSTEQTVGLEAQYGGVGARKWGCFGRMPDAGGLRTQYALQLFAGNSYGGGSTNANLILFDSGTAYWSTTEATYGSYRVAIGGANGDICGYTAAGVLSFKAASSDGNLERIKGLDYSWPAAHAAGYLYDNGSGTLSWAAAPAQYWTDSGSALYPTTAGRDVVVRKADTTTTITLAAATGSATFAGNVTAQGNAVYVTDANTYLNRTASLLNIKTDRASIYLWNATHTVILGNGTFYPSANNTIKCGDTATRWSNVYSVLGSFTGQITCGAAGAAPLSVPLTSTKVLYFDSDLHDGYHATEASEASKIPVRDANQLINAAGLVQSVNYYLKPGDTGTALAVAGDITATGKSVYASALVHGSYHVTPGGATSAVLAGTVSATQYTSTIPTASGAPFVVASQTEVTNLNAYLLNGHSSTTAATGNTIALRSASGDLTGRVLISSVSTGTPPFTVSSATKVPLLNVTYLNGFPESDTASGDTIARRGLVGQLACAALTCTGITVNAGNIVLSALGATVDGVDLSAFYTAYGLHPHHFTATGTISNGAITLSGSTNTNTNFLDKQIVSSGTGATEKYFYMSDSAGGGSPYWSKAVLQDGTHTHPLSSGTASQAASTFSGTVDQHTSAPV